MAITNGYCTLAESKAVLRLTDSADDTLLENCIEGASRRVDGYCGRFFYTTNQTVQLFPVNEYSVNIPDLSTSSGLIVKTDSAGNGTFTTTFSASDFYLEPTDVALQGRPFNRITIKGNKTFPFLYQPPRPSVEVTGTFGFPSIPDDVREATLLLTIRGFGRYNAALGVVGFGDMAIQVRAVDPDVRDLLSPYRMFGVI